MKTTDELLDAPDKPPTLFIFSIIAGTFIIVFVCWALAYPLLSKFTYKYQDELQTGMGNKERLMYIQKQDAFLNSASSSKMPIEQAMDELIRKENK